MTSNLRNLSDTELVAYYKLLKESPPNMSSRKDDVKNKGMDTKFCYHLLRLLDEAQQLIETGEMDLQRAKEAMKAIRRGEWKIDDLIDWAKQKEKELDIAFTNCKLPDKAPEDKLKGLLIECLEEHYGSLTDSFQQPNWAIQALEEMDRSLAKIRNELHGGKSSKPWWKVW